MATFYKRKGARGIRWTARVRLGAREATKTFATKKQAETWARAQESAIESGQFHKPVGSVIFADLVDLLTEYRKTIRRPLGKTAVNALARLRATHGMEPAEALTEAFWRKHALSRISKDKTSSQTAAQDLLYASAIVRHAVREKGEKLKVDAIAPSMAREKLRDEDHLRVTSRTRQGRISDDQLVALLAWIDDNADRTHVPLGDIVRFALSTSMRRGEIITIKHEDLDVKKRVVLVRNRKDARDQDRVDEVPLMKKHVAWPSDDPLAIIRRQPTTTGRIFPYLGDTIGFWFEAAAKGAGLRGVVFHLLRHEALSRYAERGMDLMRLQLIGGHRDLRHLQRYVRLDASKLANE